MEDKQNHDRMLAVRDGDLDQLGPIFEAYHRRLYNHFLRLTADPRGATILSRTPSTGSCGRGTRTGETAPSGHGSSRSPGART